MSNDRLGKRASRTSVASGKHSREKYHGKDALLQWTAHSVLTAPRLHKAHDQPALQLLSSLSADAARNDAVPAHEIVTLEISYNALNRQRDFSDLALAVPRKRPHMRCRVTGSGQKPRRDAQKIKACTFGVTCRSARKPMPLSDQARRDQVRRRQHGVKNIGYTINKVIPAVDKTG